jgi:hypothetical protein
MPDESLYVCRKSAGETKIWPFQAWGPLAKRPEIEASLDDEAGHELTVSERILRGDFDA